MMLDGFTEQTLVRKRGRATRSLAGGLDLEFLERIRLALERLGEHIAILGHEDTQLLTLFFAQGRYCLVQNLAERSASSSILS